MNEAQRWQIRPFVEADRDALSEICLRTGADGGDATDLFSHRALLGDVYALPYAEHDPTLVFVVDAGYGAAGYVLGTADTATFDGWFRHQWWPRVADTYAVAGTTPAETAALAAARRVGAASSPYEREYPAHLHIDLLPEVQGSGMGRRLVETFIGELSSRAVSGVHLVASAKNAGALAFYKRLGFEKLPSAQGAVAFGRRFS